MGLINGLADSGIPEAHITLTFGAGCAAWTTIKARRWAGESLDDANIRIREMLDHWKKGLLLRNYSTAWTVDAGIWRYRISMELDDPLLTYTVLATNDPEIQNVTIDTILPGKLREYENAPWHMGNPPA